MQVTRHLPISTHAQSLQKFTPVSETSSLSPSEQRLLNTWLDDWEKKGIQYFLDNRHPISGLVLDKASQLDMPAGIISSTAQQVNTLGSIAATGYGLLAWALAVENNILSLKEAKGWTLQALNTVANNITFEQFGWMYHFVKVDSGQPYPGSEISSVDTAIFLLSALIAGEYFGDEIKQKAQCLFDEVDFSIMLSNNGQNPNKQAFSHGFFLEDEKTHFISFILFDWKDYSEGIMVPLLALGATNYSVPDSVWHKGWDRTKNWKYGELETFAPLPLFTYFYPLGFFNLKDRKDSQSENFWSEAQKAIEMQLLYCKDNGYPEGSFGLSACYNQSDYIPYAPDNNHPNKIISPITVLACLPLKEKQTFDLLLKARQNKLDQYKYGLPGSYDLESGWVAPYAIGIDIGSALLMTDIYRRGLIHRLSDQNEVIQTSLRRAGFLNS